MELFLYDVIPERATGEDNKKAQEDEMKQQQPSYGVNNTALELEAAVASKITIHDLLKGVKDMDGNPYLQAQDYPDMPLVALHNTDARKVRHMHELGGIALPSIAVTRADLPYTNFGDITLIGDAAFIDPEQKENAAYDADVYSPRYPEIYGYKVEKGAAERFARMLGTNLTKFSGETLSRTDRALLQAALENGVDGTVKGTGLTRERTVRDAWLGAQGKTQADFASEGDRDWYIREHMEAFREWVETQFAGVNKQAIMFAGYTRSGNRRTKDYTLLLCLRIFKTMTEKALSSRYSLRRIKRGMRIRSRPYIRANGKSCLCSSRCWMRMYCISTRKKPSLGKEVLATIA